MPSLKCFDKPLATIFSMVVFAEATGLLLIKRTGRLAVKLVVLEIEQASMSQVSSHPAIGVILAISEISKYFLRSASLETNFW